VSGDLAYAMTHLKVRMQPLAGGEPVVRSGYTLSILRKCPDGKWRMTRDANLMPPPGKESLSP
jgi:ketosteroid isomerase-like protein